jgi:alpha-L-rhamnosidase
VKRPLLAMLSVILVLPVLNSVAPAGAAPPGSIRAVELRTEHHAKPLGIDAEHPRLSWQLTGTGRDAMQTAYEIRAAETVGQLHHGPYLWESGEITSNDPYAAYAGPELASRQRVAWQVRVWDASGDVSNWSPPSWWEMGLLDQGDWAPAKWIEHPTRATTDPLPLFARGFAPDDKKVDKARLYLAGLGIFVPSLNGQPLTDEVLAPGYTNLQQTAEYRTYDVTRLLHEDSNTVGVQLGNGAAFNNRSATNPAVGRTRPYAWWTSTATGAATLVGPAAPGDTTVSVSSVSNFFVGATVNVDTGDGGDRLESRTITGVSSSPRTISFSPALDLAHAPDARITGSGKNVTDTTPTAAAGVTPRMIGRLEITYADGSVDTIVTDRSWRSAMGPTTTDNWFSGDDYDARREQAGWDHAGADLSASATRRDGSPTGWVDAGIAPPPNLGTELVWRQAEPVEIRERFTPTVTNPAEGTWVFDFGQNFAGWPELHLDGVPAGTVIRMAPAESLNADGTVNQASVMGGGAGRGTHVFNTYTASGDPDGETWRPRFQYFGMQYVQVTGLPAGYTPSPETITGLRLGAAIERVGDVTTSDARINRIHRMAQYSFMSNMMATFTDCPGREKLSYPADYMMPIDSIDANFDLTAYLRWHENILRGSQVETGLDSGALPQKTPTYDIGASDTAHPMWGHDPNWGGGIVFAPWRLYTQYGDSRTLTEYYPAMESYMDYLRTRQAGTGENAFILKSNLGDWVAADRTTNSLIGTWGYYRMATIMADAADLTGHADDVATYETLAANIKQAFNDHYFNTTLHRYTAAGDNGTEGATQVAQAVALDSGLVPDGERQNVLDALVELVYDYHPFGGGPHLSGGLVGVAPIVAVLMDEGGADVLWDVLQEDTRPSYGFFLQPSTAHPEGYTTIPEQWGGSDSQNHMILAQIEHWFHAGLAGIQQSDESVGFSELVIEPQVAGELTQVEGRYRTPNGEVRSQWTRSGDSLRNLHVRVPANTTAEVHVPAPGGETYNANGSGEPTYVGFSDGHQVYEVGPGDARFALEGGGG